MSKLNVGIIGCGDIARKAYGPNLRKFKMLELIACADLDPAVSERMACDLDIPHAYKPDELLADPAIDIVLNLTIPQAHAPVNLACLQAGKHIYVEKPFCLRMEDAVTLDDF